MPSCSLSCSLSYSLGYSLGYSLVTQIAYSSDRPTQRIIIIKPHWLKMILARRKIYEIRGKPCKKALGQHIYLAASGTSAVFGTAVVVDSIGPLDAEQWASLRPGHCVRDASQPYSTTYAWQLSNVECFQKPQHFTRNPGAIVWQLGGLHEVEPKLASH